MAKVKKAQAGLKAPNKRVGPVDPNGAWTAVQKQTIAGKKTPVSLKPDKELGATKMKKGGVVKAQPGGRIPGSVRPGSMRGPIDMPVRKPSRTQKREERKELRDMKQEIRENKRIMNKPTSNKFMKKGGKLSKKK